MKNILRVTATVAATMLLGTQTLMPATVFADNQSSLSAQQILAQLDTEEQEKFETLTDYLGITDLNTFFDEVRSQSYSPDDYIDLDGDGDLTLDDAYLIVQFLHGTVAYPYDYNDMDATNDHVIDVSDELAYAGCYSYHILFHNPFTPGTHGAAIPAESSRQYRRYSFTTHQEESSYWLSSSQLPASINSNLPLEIDHNHNPRQTFTPHENSKIVLITGANGSVGSGFIIGNHVIATAAHCVFSKGSDSFTLSAVTAFTYDTNHNIYNHSLTLQSVHIPSAYASGTGNEEVNNDYALIYVSDDLSDTYDEYECGIILDGLDKLVAGTINGSEVLDDSGTAVTVKGFVPLSYYSPSIPQGTYLPGMASGELYNFNDQRFTVTCDIPSGHSGGVALLNTSFNNNTQETAFGIMHSSVSINGHPELGTSSLGRGSLFIRPLLQFYYNNPNV